MEKIRIEARKKIINAIKAAGEKGITGRNIKQQTGVCYVSNILRPEDMVAEEKVGNDIIYYWVGEK